MRGGRHFAAGRLHWALKCIKRLIYKNILFYFFIVWYNSCPYLCGMKERELIAFQKEQIRQSNEREKSLLEQIVRLSDQIDRLSYQFEQQAVLLEQRATIIKDLTATIQSNLFNSFMKTASAKLKF